MKIKHNLFRFICTVLCLSFVFGCNGICSAAGEPGYQSSAAYYSYEYNGYGEIVSAPDGYLPSDTVYLSDLGIDMRSAEVTDMCFAGGRLYVLDAGNSRVIVLNVDYSLERIIEASNLTSKRYTDMDFSFQGAGGVYVEKDGRICICDTQRERVLFIENDEVVGMIERPATAVLSEQIKFDVKSIVKSGSNYYVIANSVISGAMVFDESCNFLRFFGGNNVAVTGEVLLHALQSIYMSDEQIAARRKFSSSKITGVDVDENGFIVVVSSDPELTLEGTAVRCLNFKGEDITPDDDEDNFGDRDITKATANAFSDVAVDEDNFYTLLDSKYGRVFVYSSKGVLVSAFGGIGKETGMFVKPVSVEAVKGQIIVLDANDGSLTFFSTTDYSRVKRNLLQIIDGGNYEKIAELSESLLKYNTNCRYAYYAKGFVCESQGDYGKAMSYYKSANDQNAYSQAYKLYRSQNMKKNFIPILLVTLCVIAVLIAGVIALKRGLKKKEGMAYAPLEFKKSFPLYCLFHPADGFCQIKTRPVLSVWWLCGIVAALIYITVNRFFYMGYIFNDNRAKDFNILILLTQTVGVLLLFVLANWSICTLMDGKGKPKEIMYVTVYSLLPYILSLVITLLLSESLTSEESVIISIIMTFGILWTAVTLFVGLLTIHEYSVGKALFSVFLTVVGMAVIILLLVMFCTLIAQTVTFVQSLIQEYSLRH